jgi:hypothetical protein
MTLRTGVPKECDYCCFGPLKNPEHSEQSHEWGECYKPTRLKSSLEEIAGLTQAAELKVNQIFDSSHEETAPCLFKLWIRLIGLTL